MPVAQARWERMPPLQNISTLLCHCMQARLNCRGLERCRYLVEPVRALQLLPCGHMMCEECHAKSYPRGMKGGPRCAFCRKPFAASSAFRCPLQPSRQLRRDDPKYAMVHFCLPQSKLPRHYL